MWLKNIVLFGANTKLHVSAIVLLLVRQLSKFRIFDQTFIVLGSPKEWSIPNFLSIRRHGETHLVHKGSCWLYDAAVCVRKNVGTQWMMNAGRNCTKNLIATYQGAWCTLNELSKNSRRHEGQQRICTAGITELTPLQRPSLSLKMISLGLNHPSRRTRKKHLHPTAQRLSSPCYRLCSSNRWPLDLDFAVRWAHVLRVAIKSKYVRFTASGDLSTILQRTRVKEGSKPQRDYNGHEQVIQVLVLQENEHTQSFKFCNYQLHTAPCSLHFDIPKHLEGWNDNLYSTTCKADLQTHDWWFV